VSAAKALADEIEEKYDEIRAAAISDAGTGTGTGTGG
jgi:cell division GTPase FtsZ